MNERSTVKRSLRSVISCIVLRLCVRLRSVGIERSGSLHKTAVISWLRIINEKLKLK